jgi:hypothetical protein
MESPGAVVEQGQSAGRAGPESPFVVLQERADHVVGQALGVVGIVAEELDLFAAGVVAHEPLSGGAHPEGPVPGLEQRSHPGPGTVAQGDRLDGPATRIESVDSAVGSDPEMTRAGAGDGEDGVARQLRRAGALVRMTLRLRVEPPQTGLAGGEPEAPLLQEQRAHGVDRGVVGVTVAHEAVGPVVPAADATALGGHPQVTLLVFGNGPDRARREALEVRQIGVVDDDGVAVVAIQPIDRAEPHETA